MGPSGGTRGSFHVVVRLLWSTKKGQPVCGSILISQPGGRGSRSPLPDAACIIGEWVAALMLGRGRGRPGREAAGVRGAESRGAGPPGAESLAGRGRSWSRARRRRVREAGAGHLYELKERVTWPGRGGSVWK